MVATHKDTGVVPVTDGSSGILRGRVQGIAGCRGVWIVEPEGVVANLIFRARLIDAFGLFGRAVKDTAVASMGDFPVYEKIEVGEGVGRNQVPCPIDAGQRAIPALP